MNDFARQLEALIPRLRRYARALTRDVSRADDVVQSCLTRALAKQHLWQPGSDLRAWLFTILHNQYVNEVRSSVRDGINVAVEEMAPMLTVQSNAIAVLQLRDLEAAIARLPQEQRQVILLVVLEGMAYEQVAAVLQVSVVRVFDDADLLLRRKLSPGGAADLLHNLFRRFLHRPGFLSHLRSFNGYDGPEILPSSTGLFCLIGADAGQSPRASHHR
jgi:RNA polymerase sigma-70 factor (ECF subfamily)